MGNLHAKLNGSILSFLSPGLGMNLCCVVEQGTSRSVPLHLDIQLELSGQPTRQPAMD